MNTCEHCGGDKLLHLFRSVGPEPCPKCVGKSAPAKKNKEVQTGAVYAGQAGYYIPAVSGAPMCKHQPSSGWHCTRPLGHSGTHAGHAGGVQHGTWEP
jgi:hypothetical protein